MFFVNLGKILRTLILYNICERRSYWCENIYPMAFLATVSLSKKCLPWCLLSTQKKSVSETLSMQEVEPFKLKDAYT